MIVFRGLLIAFGLALCGACASSPDYQGLEEYDQDSAASPHAYRADAMAVRRPMLRRENRNWQFYYKHCSEIGEETYYSKTAYACMDPY